MTLLALDIPDLDVTALLPVAVVVVITIVAIVALRAFFNRKRLGAGVGQSFAAQIATIVAVAIGAYAFVLTFPMQAETRSDVMNVLGLAFTAAIAFSSTTLVSNAMAGLMLRAVRSFKPGDYVRVGDTFGRVTERELFHTEVQTEDRDLTTLPNLYLVTHPVTVIGGHGTIVAATVSLGYDVPHGDAEAALLEAAKCAGLQDGHVLVRELGDFSVTYRVGGFLADVKLLLTTRSELRRSMLDELHGAGIEIVSPAFMNQRRIAPDAPVIPGRPTGRAQKPNGVTAEVVAFDKADRVESIEQLEAEITELRGKLATADADERERLQLEITQRSARVQAMAQAIESHIDKAQGED